MHHLGEVVQCAACAVRTYSVYEPETLFFINMTEERLQSCMCQVRGMMSRFWGLRHGLRFRGMVTCVLEAGVTNRQAPARSAELLNWQANSATVNEDHERNDSSIA